jgi:hypothetical protein
MNEKIINLITKLQLSACHSSNVSNMSSMTKKETWGRNGEWLNHFYTSCSKIFCHCLSYFTTKYFNVWEVTWNLHQHQVRKYMSSSYWTVHNILLTVMIILVSTLGRVKKDWQCWHNVTVRRLLATTAYNAHAQYCHLWTARDRKSVV